MTNVRIRKLLLGAVVLSLAMPAVASADVSPGPDKDRARLLRAKAEALYDQPSEWRRAAKLLEASAELRTADDPEAYECLFYAGRIRGTLGDFSVAAKLLERAADHALARGAVMDAAQAYLDAAIAAKSNQDATSAVELLGKARLLAGSPQLTDLEKGLLLSRLG
jgi:tetratricopeptide (TPR) repeat protein